MKRDISAVRPRADGRASWSGRAADHRRAPSRRFRWLRALAIIAIITGLSGLTAQATILVNPRNVALSCPPGTRMIFKPLVSGHSIFFDTWTITAITKSGKTVTSGTFSSEDDSLFEPAEEAFRIMVELCEELSQPGSSSARSRQLITTGLQPSDVALGSFNGDNLPDLAIANQGSNSVSVALGTAGGGFGPSVSFPTGNGPVRIAVGDFTASGKQDIVTVNIGSGLTGNLSLLLGNGDGTFQAPIAIAAGTLPLDVVLGDWNGDGKLDLAVADGPGHAVVVRLGNGDGTFQPPVSLPAGTVSPASIAAVDLNGDGKLDLVTNGAIFLGNGNGTFQPAATFAVGLAPRLVRVGDLNRDGKPDLVTASSSANIVSVHLGKGDGTVQSARHYVTGSSPAEVSIFDLDRDGAPDLVVSNANDDHVSLFYGRGEGTLIASSAYTVGTNVGGGGFGVAVADFTGDGIPDLVTGDVALLPGLGLGRFGPAAPVPGLIGSRVVAADWNDNGKMGLAVTGSSRSTPGSALIALGNGNGSFGAPTDLPLPAGFSPFARFPLVAELNGDAKPDLVVANPGANSLSVFLNTGNGSFAPQPDVAVGNQPTWIAAGDFNHDGKLDLVVANNGDFGQGNGSIEVRLGNGNGTFAAGPVLRSGIEPDSVAVGDINGDGHLDVVAIVQSPVFDWSLNVYLGNGDGTFGAAVVVALPQDLVMGIRLADLDLDGHLDVIVSLDGTKLGLLRNRGDGSFDPPVIVDAGGGVAVVGDLNRDGRPDLVVATQIGVVNVLLNVSPVTAPGTVASVLPASRAVGIGSPATAFATILNPSGAPFSNCDITPIPVLPATFLFQTTDPATNLPTGSPNARVAIPPGGAMTFVLAFTPQAAFPPVGVEFAFACDGVIPAGPIPSVNTLTLSARTTPGPDIIALAASALPGQLLAAPAGAAAIATANVGAPGEVTVAADTGGTTLPLALAWCQTDAAGFCQGPPTSSPLPVSMGAGATSTFGVFASATAPIAFDPATHRVFFRIRDGAGNIIGATSLAVSGGP